MAPPIDSRLGPGTLKLGTPLVDYGAQIANVRLEPSQDSEDGTPTLGEPDPLPEVTESWVLTGEAVQDFTEPDGFVNWCADNALTEQAFEFTPDTAEGTKWTGTVLVTSVPIGGDVAAQNRAEFEFAVQGTPARTDGPASAPAGGSRAAKRAKETRRRSASRSSSSSSSPAPRAQA